MKDKREYPEIDMLVYEQLKKVKPSQDKGLNYYPCKVVFCGGEVLDCVYIVEAQEYIKVWGRWPESDPGKRHIDIKTVEKVFESSKRLPAHLANKMYKAGESGMGYCAFTIVLKDGREINCVTGNAVDFLELPSDVNTDMIIDLIPHSRSANYLKGANYYWCIYSKPQQKKKLIESIVDFFK